MDRGRDQIPVPGARLWPFSWPLMKTPSHFVPSAHRSWISPAYHPSLSSSQGDCPFFTASYTAVIVLRLSVSSRPQQLLRREGGPIGRTSPAIAATTGQARRHGFQTITGLLAAMQQQEEWERHRRVPDHCFCILFLHFCFVFAFLFFMHVCAQVFVFLIFHVSNVFLQHIPKKSERFLNGQHFSTRSQMCLTHVSTLFNMWCFWALRTCVKEFLGGPNMCECVCEQCMLCVNVFVRVWCV